MRGGRGAGFQERGVLKGPEGLGVLSTQGSTGRATALARLWVSLTLALGPDRHALEGAQEGESVDSGGGGQNEALAVGCGMLGRGRILS